MDKNPVMKFGLSIFFDNRSTKQTIVKNTFWLALARVMDNFFKLILFVYAARVLGALEYGKFSFALAFVSLFNIFFDFGLDPIIVREFSSEEEKEKNFSSLISLRIVLGIVTLLVVFITSLFVTQDILIRKIIWILTLYSLSNVFAAMFFAFFRARQKMEYEAIGCILKSSAMFGIGLYVIYRVPSVLNLSLGYFISVFLASAFILIFFHLKIQKIKLTWDGFIAKKFLLLSYPLLLTGMLSPIYHQIDSVMMGYWGQITETGWYNAAYKITWGALIPAGFVAQSFFPALSKALKESKERFQRIWNYQTGILTMVAIPLMVGGVVLAPKIIDFFYGPGYRNSVLAFQILIGVTGVTFLYTSFEKALIIFNQQKKVFWATLSGTLINVALNFMLIPKFSLYGAALATLVTHTLILLLLFEFVFKFSLINPFNLTTFVFFLGALVSTIIMYFVLSLFFNFHVLILVALGILTYCVSLFVYKKAVNLFVKL